MVNLKSRKLPRTIYRFDTFEYCFFFLLRAEEGNHTGEGLFVEPRAQNLAQSTISITKVLYTHTHTHSGTLRQSVNWQRIANRKARTLITSANASV